jgi:hypothetical protein
MNFAIGVMLLLLLLLLLGNGTWQCGSATRYLL